MRTVRGLLGEAEADLSAVKETDRDLPEVFDLSFSLSLLVKSLRSTRSEVVFVPLAFLLLWLQGGS